jgi:hypothetical protein
LSKALPIARGPVVVSRAPSESIVVFAVHADREARARAFAEALAAELGWSCVAQATSERAVVLGIDAARQLAPLASIALTGGLPEATWSPEARALRGEIDLRLSEHRPALARFLAAEIAVRTRGA